MAASQGLLKATLENTNLSVFYITSSLSDPGIDYKHPKLKTFFVGSSFVRDYFFRNLDTSIMVTTMPDLENFNLKRSRNNVHYIYVQHSLVSLHCVYRQRAFIIMIQSAQLVLIM